MTKFKKRKEEQEGKDSNYVSKIFKKNKKKTFKKETSSLGGSSDDSPPSPAESQNSDDYDDGLFEKKFFSYSTRAQQVKRKEAAKQKRRRKNPHPAKLQWSESHFNLFSDVVSDDQWRQKTTCCGLVYECEELGSVIINVASFKPCFRHQPTPAAAAPPQIPHESTSTAIKKHQLFLKRHSEPSVVVEKSSDVISSCSNVASEFSSNNEKTETLMDSNGTAGRTMTILLDHGDEMKNGELEGKKFCSPGIFIFALREFLFLLSGNFYFAFRDIRFRSSKTFSTFFSPGHNDKMEVEDILSENTYDKKEPTSKLLQELTSEKTKSSQINPLSSVNGDKMSLLKFKLTNMARFVGNDNSSDSGYEEVQDGSKLLASIAAQMPPPADVLQSL